MERPLQDSWNIHNETFSSFLSELFIVLKLILSESFVITKNSGFTYRTLEKATWYQGEARL